MPPMTRHRPVSGTCAGGNIGNPGGTTSLPGIALALPGSNASFYMACLEGFELKMVKFVYYETGEDPSMPSLYIDAARRDVNNNIGRLSDLNATYIDMVFQRSSLYYGLATYCNETNMTDSVRLQAPCTGYGINSVTFDVDCPPSPPSPPPPSPSPPQPRPPPPPTDNSTAYCRFEWQGTAPFCDHKGYCDSSWTYTGVNQQRCSQGEDCHGVGEEYFGRHCLSGYKALCQLKCEKVEGNTGCDLPCLVPPPF